MDIDLTYSPVTAISGLISGVLQSNLTRIALLQVDRFHASLQL